MSKIIVNLITPVVVNEAEIILNAYPQAFYRKAFTASDLRQKLITYVLTRIPSNYTVVEEADEMILNAKPPCSSEQRQHIKMLINQGIQHILHEPGEESQIDQPLRESASTPAMPSTWFG